MTDVPGSPDGLLARLPIIPLEVAALPGGGRMPLRIFEPRFRTLLRDIASDGRRFGTVLIERGSEVGGGDDRRPVGVLASILTSVPFGDSVTVLASLGPRIRVRQWFPDDPYPVAEAELWPDETPGILPDRDLLTVVAERAEYLNALAARVDDEEERPGSIWFPREATSTLALAEHIVTQLPALELSEHDRYAILAAPSVAERYPLVLDALEGVIDRLVFERPELAD